MTNIRITALTDIGNNIAYSSLVPVVDMAGTPTTKKANLQIVGNLILNGAGGSYFAPAARAILSQSVTNAAQPNITSVGTLTSLAVSGNITAGNVTGGNLTTGGALSVTGNANVGNLGTTSLSVAGTSNLNNVSNVTVLGGTSGQVLTTNGSGGLSWTTVSGGGSDYSNSNVATYLPTFTGTVGANIIRSNSNSGSNLTINANGANFVFGQGGALYWPAPNGANWVIDASDANAFEVRSTSGVVISTDISNANAHFNFDTDGVFTAPGNVNLEGTRLNVGPGAANVPLETNPTLVVTDSGLEFIQAALINQNPNGSSDYAVYGSGSDETQGFADLGFAGPTFNDPNYSITPPGDGYVFVQGYANGLGGALTLATGQNGNNPDIVFATGGFTSGAEFGRIDHANNVLYLSRGDSGIKFSDGTIQTTAAGAANTGNVTFNQSNISTNQANTDIQIIGNGTGGINIQSNSSVWTFDDSGDFLAPGNVTLAGTQILVGPTANALGLDDATLVISSSSDAYLQAVLNNVSDIGSADWVAQGHHGNDIAGWADLGFTSASYSDEGNSMFGPGTGYVIVNGYLPGQAPALGTGSLILATMGEGTEKDIIFGTGGGYAENIFGRISDANNLFELSRANAGIKFTDGSIQTTAYTGGGGNTGNVTFDDVTVQGVNELNLSAGPDYTANLAYLQVRAGDVASHIHFDTGNSEAYDLIVGNDQKFVQVSSTGNIIMSSYDGNTSYAMTLDTTGNLILAGGNSVIQSIANSSLDPLSPNTSTMILTPDAGYSSQSLVLDPTLPGHIHLRAPSANIDEPLANIFLGGEDSSFEVGYYNGSAPNLFIHSGGNTWTFSNDGTTTFPTGNITSNTSLQFTTTFANVKTVEYQTAGVWDLYVEDSITGSNTASSRLNVTFNDNLIDKPQVYIENTKESDGIALRWTFDENGNLNFPRDVAGNTDPYLTIVSGANPGITSTDASLAGPANLGISALTTTFTGFTGDAIKIYPDDGEISSTANLQIWANSGGNTEYSWTFDTTGNLTTPSNLVIGPGPGSGSSIFQYNEGLQILGEGANSVVQMGWTANTSAPDSVTTIAMNYPGGGEGNILIAVGNNATTVNYWLFDNTGNLRLPGNTFAVNYANGTQVPVGVTQDITSNGAMSIMTYDGNLKYVNNATVEPSTGNITGGNLITTGSVTAANITLPNSSVLTFGDTPVTNRYYIDATRTDTYTEDGSQARPFKTIAGAQAAIATAISGGLNPQVEPVYMILLSNITENVTLATNHVYLIGQNGQIHQPIILSGDITVNPTSGTLNTNHFSITGLEVVGTTNGKAIYVTGTSPLRLSLQDVWITANGTGAGLYQDNTGTGTYTHGGPIKVSHNGSGDVYCFDIRKGTASFDTVETSGATQVGAAGPGATLTFNNSQLDANGDVVVETYGNGILVVTNSAIKNSQANGYGIKMNAVANVAGTVSVGQSAFNVPAGTGQAVWLDPNTTAGLSGVFAWAGVSFYPGTNTTINPSIIPAPLTTLVGTIAAPIIVGDITATGTAQDWDLIDNNASALSFDTTGKSGIINLVTTNGAEGVTMSGTLSVTGNANVGNLNTSGQITSTKAGNLSDGGGQLYLNGSGNNRIDFNTNGTGAPAFTTRSAGTKVVLYPSIGASATDYAVGVDSGTLWSGIPAADAGQFFKWYGGTTEVANLSGTGTLTVTGNIAGANISTTGTLTSTGKIGYASGSTVTQTSNRGNGVNINALAGTIVTVSASMTAGEIGAFSVTNNQVDTNNDIVLVQVVSPNLGNYNVIANPNSGIGGFYLTLQNISGFPISAEAVTIRFMVIKAPNA